MTNQMMEYLILSVLFIAWVGSGCWAFVFWWTKDYDFTQKQIGTMLLAALLGPLGFLVGATIHGGTDAILIPRRAAHQRQTKKIMKGNR